MRKIKANRAIRNAILGLIALCFLLGTAPSIASVSFGSPLPSDSGPPWGGPVT